MVSSEEKEECLKKIMRMSFQSGQEKEVRELLHDLLLRDTNGGKLYRFRPFDEVGYSLKNFEDGTVYCSRPSAFNDPFEAKPGMSLENMNEEVYGDKFELLSELGEKFCQIVNEEMKLEECNEHEQRVIKQFLKNEKLKEFAIKGKGQETIDVKSFLQEFIQMISGDEKLVKGIEVNTEETLRLFENISSEKLLEVTEKDSSLRWLARANGINEDTDDLGLIYLLAKKLFPEKIDEAEHRLKDIKDVQQNIYSYYEECLIAAKIQGFTWDKSEYYFEELGVTVAITEEIYLSLVARMKELSVNGGGGGLGGVPFGLKGSVSVVTSDTIDTDYMNSRFEKYRKALEVGNAEDVEKALVEVHSSFAMLSKEEQKYADIFLKDIQRGDIKIEPGKTLRDYITEYREAINNTQIHRLTELFGLKEDDLRALIESRPTESNINEYGRFDKVKESLDKEKVKAFFEKHQGRKLMPYEVSIESDRLLRKIVLEYQTGVINSILPKEGE